MRHFCYTIFRQIHDNVLADAGIFLAKGTLQISTEGKFFPLGELFKCRNNDDPKVQVQVSNVGIV